MPPSRTATTRCARPTTSPACWRPCPAFWTAEIAAVTDLVAALGVPPEDHIVRPTAARGRAVAFGLGEAVGMEDLPAEVTYTVDGLFWSPFAPTVRGGRLDTDLLVSRRILPIEAGVRTFMGLLTGAPLAEAGRFR
jgi:hypothetical protein